MPQLSVTVTEASAAGGIPTDTGAAFIAVQTDAGPPPGGPPYVECFSITNYVNAFGPRSSTSAIAYDWLDEFFHDGGAAAIAYVTRVTDNTAVSALLTLNDGLPVPKPTVVCTALTAGLAGNGTYVQVLAGTNPTFTATTATSTALTAISSTKNIGPGTPITGTGIPAGTYIVSVDTVASSAVLSQPATASGSLVVITPGTATIQVQDATGEVLETHGPYYLTSQLFADLVSTYLVFSQSAAIGFTVNLPAVLSATPLAGGADANDLTDASFVSALANFPPSLGPGTVCLPGKTSTAAWNGLDGHAVANNRWAVKDMADNTAAASVAAAAQTSGYARTSYGMFVQGSLILPPIAAGANRIVPGSAAVAALRSQVAATPNQNQAPCGKRWPLAYPLGFTTYYGPLPSAGLSVGCFNQSDVQTLEAAGVNVFANFYSVPCLYGFVTPIPKTSDPVFWQASQAVERMNLYALGLSDISDFLFAPITVKTIIALNAELTATGLQETHVGALSTIKPDGTYGSASDAFSVMTGPPVNTALTAESGQLNAQMQVRLTPYADMVNLAITVVPLVSPVVQNN